MTRLVTPACSSPPSVVQRLRAAARSPMGGASLPATRTRNIQPAPRAVRRRRHRTSAVERPLTHRGSRRPIRFARRKLERITRAFRQSNHYVPC
jgi:hypothetical protein